MKVLLIGAAAAVALAGAASAQDHHRGPMAADTDGDSRLNQAEFIAAAMARFDASDANRDSVISTDEVQAAVRARRAEGRERIFAALDSDSDGVISRAEFDARAEGRGERGEGFRRGGHHRRFGGRGGPGGRGGFEADGVTRAEAETRATAMFDRMDANDDGYLSPEDRQGRRWGLRGAASE